MRVFIAIAFSDKVKQYLRTVQDIIKTTAYGGNFTHYKNFHLTIKYIGNIYNGEYEELTNCLDDICEHTTPFSIRIGDIGMFHKKSSSIVWVDVTKGKKLLKELFQEVEKEVTKSGFDKEERKYRAHITLAKKVMFQNGTFTNGLPYFDYDIPCTKLTLFESHRVDGIVTYTPLYTKDFTG